jgi:hypothetical protein
LARNYQGDAVAFRNVLNEDNMQRPYYLELRGFNFYKKDPRGGADFGFNSITLNGPHNPFTPSGNEIAWLQPAADRYAILSIARDAGIRPYPNTRNPMSTANYTTMDKFIMFFLRNPL